MAPESVDAADPYIVRLSAWTCTTCQARQMHRRIAFSRRSHGFVQKLRVVYHQAAFEHELTTPVDLGCVTLSLFNFLNWRVYPKALMFVFVGSQGYLCSNFHQMIRKASPTSPRLSRRTSSHQNRRTIAFFKEANSFSKANGVLAIRWRTEHLSKGNPSHLDGQVKSGKFEYRPLPKVASV